jgi:hypothetical protein
VRVRAEGSNQWATSKVRVKANGSYQRAKRRVTVRAQGTNQRAKRRVRLRSETSDQRAKTRARVRKKVFTKCLYRMKARAKVCIGEIGRVDGCHLKFGEFKRRLKVKVGKFQFRATVEGSMSSMNFAVVTFAVDSWQFPKVVFLLDFRRSLY